MNEKMFVCRSFLQLPAGLDRFMVDERTRICGGALAAPTVVLCRIRSRTIKAQSQLCDSKKHIISSRWSAKLALQVPT
jgi:hypothetical protein